MVSVCAAWLTFALTFGLTLTAPAALTSRPAAAALSAATVTASAVAALSACGVQHAAYTLVPVLVATHSMVPAHVAVACLATAAVVAAHVVTLLVEAQWTPDAQHVKQVRRRFLYFGRLARHEAKGGPGWSGSSLNLPLSRAGPQIPNKGFYITA